MKKYSVALFILIIFNFTGSGQVIISWNSIVPDHFMIDDLWNLTISKTSPGTLECMLELKIETNNHVPVITLTTFPFYLQNGITDMRFIKSTVRSSLKFGNNIFSSTLQQVGSLPMGNYIFCATLVAPINSSILGLSCEERQLSGTAPPYLLSPYNNEEIMTTYPLLTWHGPAPADMSRITYSLVLTAMYENQHPEQAIKNNVPLVNQKNIASTFLNYTSLFAPLNEGKSYAWKVYVFYDQHFFGSTEVWQFKVRSSPSTVDEHATGSYRIVNHAPADGFYLADDFLRIGYDNRNNDTLLNFRIMVADSRKKIEFDQEVILQHGINTIDLDMKKGSFKEDTPYLLLIEDGNSNRFQVTFYFIKS